jgi:hypothetical protein
MDVPTPAGREPLKTTLFNGEMQVGQEARSCSSKDEPGEVNKDDKDQRQDNEQDLPGGAHHLRADILHPLGAFLQLLGTIELGLVHFELLTLEVE